MYAKAIKGNQESVYSFSHVQITNYPSDYPTGTKGPIDRITVELVGAKSNSQLLKPGQSNIITIPDDADVVYLLNDAGKTIGTHSLEVANRSKQEATSTFKVAK